jgi:hypothetical protein
LFNFIQKNFINRLKKQKMVCVYALIVLKYKYLPEKSTKPVILSGFIDGTSWYSYFYQSALIEFSQFFSKLLVEKTEVNVRQQVYKDGYSGYVQKKGKKNYSF